MKSVRICASNYSKTVMWHKNIPFCGKCQNVTFLGLNTVCLLTTELRSRIDTLFWWLFRMSLLIQQKRGRVSVFQEQSWYFQKHLLGQNTRKLWIEILFNSLAFLLTIYAFVIKSLTVLVIPDQSVYLERFCFCSVKSIKHTHTDFYCLFIYLLYLYVCT